MSKLTLFVSATFVLIFVPLCAIASPQPEVPDSRVTEPQAPTQPPNDNMIMSKPPRLAAPPPPLPPEEPRYYSARQALTARIGLISDPDSHQLNRKLFGFQYLLPKFLSPKVEAGADLLEGGRGHIHAGVRWYWWEKDYFRPSVKASFDHLLIASQGLGTLAKWENSYLRGSGTLEYVVSNPYSVRLEYEVLVSSKEVAQIISLGLSRGW